MIEDTKSIVSQEDARSVDAAARLLNRRQMLRMGGAGVITLVGLGGSGGRSAFAKNSIVSTPALEEGPYWIDETGAAFHRVDVRANVNGKNAQPGLPLHLELNVGKIVKGALVPLPNAFIYIWHCSASGIYSGEAGLDSGADTFLRGYQVTDAKGAAKFLTIYPGWYGGRTAHIHARIRLYPGSDPTKKPIYDYETQFFFDDAATNKLYKSVAPYNRRSNRDTSNADDPVYTGGSLDANGVTANAGTRATTHLTVKPAYATASFGVALNLALKEPAGGGPKRGGPGGPGGFRGHRPPPGPPPDFPDSGERGF